MAQEIINIGAQPNDGDGDSLRVAFTKVNNDFSDLYSRGLPVGADGALQCNQVIVDGHYVTVGNDSLQGSILTSTDGATWAVQYVSASYLNAVVYDTVAEQWLVVGGTGTTGTILTSPDSTFWTPYASSLPVAPLFGVAVGTNIGGVAGAYAYVAVGGAGSETSYIVASQDLGASWTRSTAPTTTQLNSVVWSDQNQLFVAVGNAGTILTSPDGVFWTQQVSHTTADLADVTKTGNLIIATGTAGTILASSDATNWTVYPFPTTANVLAVANAFNLTWVGTDLTSFGGTSLYSSPDLQNWTASPEVLDAPVLALSSTSVDGTPTLLASTAATKVPVLAVTPQPPIPTPTYPITFTIPTQPEAPAVGSVVTLTGFVPSAYNVPLTVTASTTTSVTGVFTANPGTVSLRGNLTLPGAVLSTVDGVTWTTASTGAALNLAGVGYGEVAENSFGAANIVWTGGNLTVDGNITATGTVTANAASIGTVAAGNVLTANLTAASANLTVANIAGVQYAQTTGAIPANTANAIVYSFAANSVPGMDAVIVVADGNGNQQETTFDIATNGSNVNWTMSVSPTMGTFLAGYDVQVISGNVVITAAPLVVGALSYTVNTGIYG